ncbi:hypothetical protein KKY_2154 [Pelagibacterium halotolerans B2]|uniref:Uncharacterized protein n=1 Tax=Pelagibacterium halotolerans (strain DSM 22347 / JCM 15775 / CGMCC 1.7692 / B2) TaxID=1082931 RepID=G4R670_PELHB|nr:hypothetical protein [Pelagibacterium halotolerans]AEQ52163.1 hypothetical protein KKY_2154 [Pelagibacterium halotolerans B2]
MPRHKKPAPADPHPKHDTHAAYAALMARLTAFQAEISAQAKARATAQVPEAVLAMAVDLMAQMARLMARAIEARGLIAFAQAHHAFMAFGRRKGFDKPVADAEARAQHERNVEDLVRLMNGRILRGIRDGYLCPVPDDDPDRETERRAISDAHTALVSRMEAYLGHGIDIGDDW